MYEDQLGRFLRKEPTWVKEQILEELFRVSIEPKEYFTTFDQEKDPNSRFKFDTDGRFTPVLSPRSNIPGVELKVSRILPKKVFQKQLIEELGSGYTIDVSHFIDFLLARPEEEIADEWGKVIHYSCFLSHVTYGYRLFAYGYKGKWNVSGCDLDPMAIHEAGYRIVSRAK